MPASVEEISEVDESPGLMVLDRGTRSEETDNNDTSPEETIALARRATNGDWRRTVFSFTTVSNIVFDMLMSLSPESSCCR